MSKTGSRLLAFTENVLTSGHTFGEHEQVLRLKFRLLNLFLLFNLLFIAVIVSIRWLHGDFDTMWLDAGYALAIVVVFALARTTKAYYRYLVGTMIFLIYSIATILFYYEPNPLGGISWYVLFLMVTAVFLGHTSALISYVVSAITIAVIAMMTHHFSSMTVVFGMLPYTAALLFAYFFISENTLMLRTIESQKHRYIQLSKTDTLTGMANREHFHDRLRQGLVRLASQEPSGHLAVLFIDLDRFKETNDTHGHSVGDWVLSTIAKRIKDSIRDVDLLARYGGDEFTVLLWNHEGLEHLRRIVERIMSATAQPIEVDALRIVQHVSIGIAVAPQDGLDAEMLLERADLAMYYAKRRPGSTYAFYRRPHSQAHLKK